MAIKLAATKDGVKVWSATCPETRLEGVYLERADGSEELIGWAASADWVRGEAGTLRLSMASGDVLKIVRTPMLPLPPPPVDLVDEDEATRAWSSASIIDQLAQDYLREIATFVDEPEEETRPASVEITMVDVIFVDDEDPEFLQLVDRC